MILPHITTFGSQCGSKYTIFTSIRGDLPVNGFIYSNQVDDGPGRGAEEAASITFVENDFV